MAFSTLSIEVWERYKRKPLEQVTKMVMARLFMYDDPSPLHPASETLSPVQPAMFYLDGVGEGSAWAERLHCFPPIQTFRLVFHSIFIIFLFLITLLYESYLYIFIDDNEKL